MLVHILQLTLQLTMYNTLMLVLTNFVQVLTALTNFVPVLTAHTYHSCDVLVPNSMVLVDSENTTLSNHQSLKLHLCKGTFGTL